MAGHIPAALRMHEPYQRRLPHVMPPGETLFITFRLHGTVPYEVLRKLKEEHELLVEMNVQDSTPIEATRKQLESQYFASFDTYLDSCSGKANWLSDETIAGLVIGSLHFGDKTSYDLHAFCIMPNHVHLLVTVLAEQLPFFAILQRIKTFTAVRANRLLNQVGQSFWASESYDHVVRNQKSFDRIIRYILNNPVKAGLIENWEDWPFSYWKV